MTANSPDRPTELGLIGGVAERGQDIERMKWWLILDEGVPTEKEYAFTYQ